MPFNKIAGQLNNIINGQAFKALKTLYINKNGTDETLDNFIAIASECIQEFNKELVVLKKQKELIKNLEDANNALIRKVGETFPNAVDKWKGLIFNHINIFVSENKIAQGYSTTEITPNLSLTSAPVPFTSALILPPYDGQFARDVGLLNEKYQSDPNFRAYIDTKGTAMGFNLPVVNNNNNADDNNDVDSQSSSSYANSGLFTQDNTTVNTHDDDSSIENQKKDAEEQTKDDTELEDFNKNTNSNNNNDSHASSSYANSELITKYSTVISTDKNGPSIENKKNSSEVKTKDDTQSKDSNKSTGNSNQENNNNAQGKRKCTIQ